MNWFKNRRMAIKLAIAFGACVLLTGVVGYQALQGMGVIKTHNDRLDEHSRGWAAIKDVNLEIIRTSRAVRNAMLDDNAADIQRRIDEVKDSREKFTSALEDFEKTIETDEARQALAELRRLDAQIRPAQDEILSLAVQGKIDDAKGKLKPARALADAIDVQVARIEGTKKRIMETAVRDSNDAYDTTSRAMLAVIAIAVGVAIGVAFLLTRIITQPLGESVRLLRAVAQADFSRTLQLDTQDELGDMATALNEAIVKVRTTLEDVRGASDTVASAAQQLASASEEISSGAQEQASSLEETAASLEEMTATIKQNADNAQQASQLAGGARNAAENGGQVMGDVVNAMGAINESSKRIADIITTIDEIAFQTNLLALNAAVEAARAGEQGRGFAVVAAEVRNLAQRSASAAKEIKTLIQDSVRKVDAGSELVNASGRTLTEIVTSVKRVTDIVAEIAAASREQAGGIEQVNRAVTQMDQVTQANASQTEEMSGTAESLAGEAGKLQTLIAQFNLGDTRPSAIRTHAGPKKTAAFTPRTSGKSGAGRLAGRMPAAVINGSGHGAANGAGALDAEFQEF
jgi:methyl-accepting chemotaxis protein